MSNNAALTEIDTALEMSAASLDDRVNHVITDAEVDKFRQRAQKQRATGVMNLKKRHEGIASVVRNVIINERVVGSAFERHMATIENGIYVIGKRGADFFGPAGFESINASILDRIADMEIRVRRELQALQVQLKVLSADEDSFIMPTYTRPASEREVQLRTPHAIRVLNVFLDADKVIAHLQALLWNAQAEQAAVDAEELQVKKEMKALAIFLNRTLKAMRNKIDAVPDAGGAAATNPAGGQHEPLVA
jgi:hypothetical protein